MGGVHAKVGHGFQVALRVRLIVDHIFLGQDQVKPVSAVKVVQHFRCVLAASCGNHGQVMGGAQGFQDDKQCLVFAGYVHVGGVILLFQVMHPLHILGRGVAAHQRLQKGAVMPAVAVSGIVIIIQRKAERLQRTAVAFSVDGNRINQCAVQINGDQSLLFHQTFPRFPMCLGRWPP